MGDVKHDNFITDAEKLLNGGRPREARDCLYRFDDNKHAVVVLRYQQLLAAACLLYYRDGGEHDGGKRLKEVSKKGVSAENEFLELYVRGIEALARHKPSWLLRRREWQQLVVAFNICYAINFCKEVNGDAIANELETKLRKIRSRS